MVKMNGVGDNYRNRRHGDQRQGNVHPQHENDTHSQQHQDADQVGHLLGNKIPCGIDVTGAPLNDVPGVMLHVPGEGETLNMGIQGVPHGLDQRFSAFGVEYPESVLRSGLDRGNGHDSRCHDPKVFPQIDGSAEGADQLPDLRAQAFRTGAADDLIHRHPDHLGSDHIRHGGKRRGKHAQKEEGPASLQK